MRVTIVILTILLTAANAASSAREAFIPQIGSARQLASSFRSSVPGIASAAKIAAPLKLDALAALRTTSSPANSNVSFVSQSGTNNLATVAQTGGNNLSAIVQNGSGNRAIVSQRR